MTRLLRKTKLRTHFAIGLLLMMVISTIAGFFASAITAHAANDTTQTKREKYGLLINDYPEVEKVGYTFDGYYTSATGGTKIDPAKWTTPLAERTDYYAHWKPNTYKLTVNYSNYRNKSQTGNNGSDVNAINNVTITATRKGSSDTRTYTLANGGTVYLKFDDVVTVRANMTGSYTQGDWFYASSTSRYKVRHNISFGGWKMTPASTTPAAPALANASASTTSFNWNCTDEIVLSCSGTDTTSKTDNQTYHNTTMTYYKVSNTFLNSSDQIHSIGNGETQTNWKWYAANWNVTFKDGWLTVTGGVHVDHDRTVKIEWSSSENGPWQHDSGSDWYYTGKSGNITIKTKALGNGGWY